MYLAGESEAAREMTNVSHEREPEPPQILPLPEEKQGEAPPGEWQAGTFGFYLPSALDLLLISQCGGVHVLSST